MFEKFQAAKAALDAADPRLFWLLLAVFAWAIVGGVRRLRPQWFEALADKWPAMQAGPAIAIGALVGAAANSESASKAFLGAFFGGGGSGILSIGMHHVAKRVGMPSKPSGSGSDDDTLIEDTPKPPTMNRVVIRPAWKREEPHWARDPNFSVLAMSVAFLGVIAIGFLLGGCSPKKPAAGVEPPARAFVRAGVLAVAKGVAVGDALCADTALQIAGDGSNMQRKARGLELATKCSAAHMQAYDGLTAAENLLDAWNDAAGGKIGCAARSAFDGLYMLQATLQEWVGKVPPEVDDAIQNTRALVAFAPAVCK